MSLADLRTAIDHAPVAAPKGPDGLTGWSGPVDVCERCAARLTARGCGHLLKGFAPVWDEHVVCALTEQHQPPQGTVNGAPIGQWLASCPPDDPADWTLCPSCRSPLRRDGKGCTSWQCPSKGARNS